MRTIRALLIASALTVSDPAVAQSEAETIAELKAQILALTARVNELERERKPPAPASETVPPPTLPLSAISAQALQAAPQVKPQTPDIAAAPIDRPLQPFGGAIQISASNESSEVALRIGTSVAHAHIPANGAGHGIEDTLSLTASAPLDKNSDRTDVGTLDGFANSAQLKLRLTRFVMPIRDPDADPTTQAVETQIEERARKACRDKAGANEDELKVCNDPDIDINFVRKWDEAEAITYRSLYFGTAPSFAFGLEGSVGYKKFSFFDATTLTKEKSSKVPAGAKGFFTLFPDASLTSITGSLEYQHAFEDQDTDVLCPIGTTAPVKCVSGPIGAPKRDDKLLAALEYRKQFILKDFWIPSIGLAPQVTYDLLNKKAAFDLPIYLVSDAKGNLLGGIRFGYNTDKKEPMVGVFVGTAFSFEP